MAGFIVFSAAFALYAVTASPTIGWLDSPELVAASASLGVAHSPGHPLAVALGHAATFLPLGDLPWRINLMSALCAAAAAVAVQTAGRTILTRALPETSSRVREVAAAALALAFATSWAAWFQAVRAEVYALEMLLVGVALAALCRFDDRPDGRWLALGGLAGGLALANHHLIALTVLVPALAVVLARPRAQRPTARAWGATALLGTIAIAGSLAYLPARAATHPELNWGAPSTAARLAWTVSARAFHKSAGAEHVSSPGQDAAQVLLAVGEEATPALLLAALLGLYLAARQARLRRMALGLAGIAGAGAAARVLVGFDPGTPDHVAYLLPAIAAVMLLGAIGLALAATAHPRAPVIAAALLAAVVPWQLSRHAAAAAAGDGHASDALARWEYQDLPPRAVVLPGYFQTSFRIAALRAVEGARPDVAVLDRSFLTYPGAAAEARRRYPALAGLIDAPLRAGAPTPVAALQALALRRPVLVQLHPNLDDAARPALLPDGPMARLPARAPDAAARAAAAERDQAARAVLARRLAATAGPTDTAGAAEALLWLDFVRLAHYCAVGPRTAAARALADAWTSAPGDTLLVDMAMRCQLELPR